MKRLTILVLMVMSLSFCIEAQPAITSFSPASGAVGSSVTITGTGFNTTAAQNVVFFGATMATVTSASASSMTVTVPSNSTFEPLSVTNLATGLSAYSAKPYIVTRSNGTTVFLPKVDVSTGNNPLNISIGDLDGDGKLDIVVTSPTDGVVSIYKNTSTGGVVSFADRLSFYGSRGLDSSGPWTAKLGDLDGDGKMDIVVADFTGNCVLILRNVSDNEEMSFDHHVFPLSGGYFCDQTSPRSLSLGDVDGDGKLDIALLNLSVGSLSVYRNTSSIGTVDFTTGVDFDTNLNLGNICLGDIDGDGKPDLAITEHTENSLSVYRNTSSVGTIDFASRSVIYTTPSSNVGKVSLGDLDGDGKSDLALANNNSVSVFRNTSSIGAVNFATVLNYNVGDEPYEVGVSDIDGDGKPDLAVTNTFSHSVSIFRNTSSSGAVSFASKVDYDTNQDPTGIAIGDINGDGGPDLCVVASTISILQNVKTPVISYNTPQVYTKDLGITALSPNSTGGTVVSYSISPALPEGLKLDETTGDISGTPTEVSSATTYTVTAINTGGSTTATLSITVNDVAPNGLSYTTPNIFTSGTAIAALSPTVSGGMVISYSISPVLPAGLNFNQSTGVISGTPSILSSITTYTVTATNTGGSVNTTLSITVQGSPSLSTPILSSIGTITAMGNVTISDLDNPADVTDFGVCWSSTNHTPTVLDSYTSNGSAIKTGQFAIPITGLTVGTTYYVCAYVTNSVGTFYGDVITFSTNATVAKQCTMKVYLEGFWNGTAMNKSQKWDDDLDSAVDLFSGTVVDTLSVELHDPDHYSTILYQANGLELNTDGSINTPGESYIDIPGDYSDSYRLTVKHRNHIETTSALPVSFAGTTIGYDFTDASAKAYQSDASFTPTKQVNGKWMMYAGYVLPVLSNPEINSNDLFYVFNHNSSLLGVYGYSTADVNGDGIVDEDDLYISFANQYVLLYIVQ